MLQDFYHIFDIQEYQDIQDRFSQNLGVSSITVLPSGKPITHSSNFCRLCEMYIRKSTRGRINCYKCNAEIGQPNYSGPIIKQCFENKGLWNAGVSIVINGVHLASWCIGQIKNESVDENYLLQFADEIKVNRNDYKEALDQVPLMSKERFEQVANILFLFVNQLAKGAHKNILLEHQIEHLKETHELLIQSKRRYKLLFEQSNDAIFIVRLPEGQYLDANEAALKLTGRTREEILNLRTRDLSPKGASRRLQQVIEGKMKEVYTQVEYLRPDGSVRQAKLIALPIDQYTIFGVAQDITDQIVASETLKYSHDLMQYIIEHNRSAIAVHDKELRYIYVSQKYLEDYGVKENQIIGRHHYEVFPDLPQKWRDVHQKALKGIISSAEEDPYQRADGSIDWTRWECRPWYDQNKEVGGIIVYTEVITGRKKMEIALRESEEKYKFLFYNNPQPSWIYDLDSLTFLEVNHAAILHYGYSRDEFLNMTLKEIRPQEDIPELLNVIHHPRPEYNLGDARRHLKKNGQVIYVNIYSHIIEYCGKQARHVLINDITDRVKLENELRAAQEKAEESDRLKSAFLANMSHEIRTPLNSILGFSDLLVDPDFNLNDKMNFVQIMKQNSDRLLSLINGILDLSKIEAGQLELNNFSFPIDELLISLQKSHYLQANSKGLELILNISGLDPGAEIFTDGDRITQILNNLLYNAIKFTEKGVIEFGLNLLSGSILFYVKDSGIGIPKEFHQLIFERFWQVDRGNNRKFEGSGMGLAITKSLVELLGGRIWIESTVGLGSTFYFTIPQLGTITNEKGL